MEDDAASVGDMYIYIHIYISREGFEHLCARQKDIPSASFYFTAHELQRIWPPEIALQLQEIKLHVNLHLLYSSSYSRGAGARL